MTPLEKARAVYWNSHDNAPDGQKFSATINAAVEAACLAYFAAKLEDEKTVEAVATAIDPNAFLTTSYPDPRKPEVTAERQQTAKMQSRRALLALAEKGKT